MYAIDGACPADGTPLRPMPSSYPTLDGLVDADAQILGHIADGGMSRVFQVGIEGRSTPVAVKVLSPEFGSDEPAVERYYREARMNLLLDHPNVVDVLRYGLSHDGHHTIVMEQLAGESLADTLDREQRLPWQRALHIAIELADALGHAHGRPHSPCGPPGNTPADIDPDYPYDDGTVGVWGYDITSGDLHDPDEATDFMGYCENAWVSDFTYQALHRRGRNVNLNVQGELKFDVYSVQGSDAEFVQTVTRAQPVAGHPIEVTRLSGGNPTTQVGYFSRWDHLPGGVLTVPHSELATDQMEAVIHGRFVRIATD